jgi:hypothetical protein
LVESMQKKHILPGFQDTSRDQETIESISHEITMVLFIILQTYSNI